ncbi:MAG: beta-N-acetylhexosaminidase [Acidobacteriota bacterium]|nr:beta-N-acetylhexosaminidase [Acidobacteriota bacterium]
MSGLLPRPRSLTPGDGAVTWTSPLRIAADPLFEGAARRFGADLASALGWDVVVGDGEGDAQIVLRRVEGLGDEGYRLRVDDVTTIEATSAAGASYALTTLRQLAPALAWSSTPIPVAHLAVARASCDDAPRFAWRGAHLDVARHFFDVPTVMRFIDLIAAHRLNRLHLHLNDDQGWRVEVPGWPRLTSVGSTRRSSPVGHERDGLDDGVAHGGFFSDEDLVRLRDYAASRYVVIVPEIDLPGHAQAAIAAYPELGNTGEALEVWTRWGISEHVLNVEDATIDFAEAVVAHVADLFPDSPVHIGGDECPSTEWESNPAAHRVMSQRGLASARDLQGLYTTRLARLLSERGHEVLAWDEVLDAEVPDGTVIVAWREAAKGVEAARRGLDVVMAPMQSVYFDWLNSDDPDEPVAIAPAPFVTTWESVYGFEVVPAHLEAELVHHIRGAQAQHWTEYIATREHLDYMAFPRLCAFSEVVWGTAGDLEEFRARLRTHLARLDAMGVAYRALEG